VEILRAGGNAVDAAVATAFALAVVYPEAGNIGGGGFMVVRFADGRTAALDFRETAPLAATATMYLDSAGTPTKDSEVGHRAVGVPGAIAGQYEAHRLYGKLPWRDVVAPSIRLAADGFLIDERVARVLQSDSAIFSRYGGSSALFLPDGRPPAAGTLFRNPDLARTLTSVADHGTAGFYEGPVAEMIVDEMNRGGGLITHEDLRRYRPAWRAPVEFTYRGYRVTSMPPPSSGGVTLALILGILEGYDLADMGWHSPRMLHLTAEAMRRAFADRNALLGDPDFVPIPLATMLSGRYAASLRASIDPGHATPSAAVTGGAMLVHEPSQTTHLGVVDAAGNAVALTTTLNGLHGCGVVVTGAGFLLNNEMDDFTSKPGSPNTYGLVQSERNAIAPGKRMLSSMTPTIVSRPDSGVVLVAGGRGGPHIITSVLHVLLNSLEFGMDAAGAVSAPRIHHQHLPDQITYERGGFDDAVLAALAEMGHSLKATGGTGSAPAIVRRNGRWEAVADPRTAEEGGAGGY
jgi:gamma-glutamyltranspeptidase/glutathione hydrolase